MLYQEWLESIKGKDGKDGHSPVITIGSDGNWYIDGVNTNVTARGEKGEKGEQGIQGIQGNKGEDGHSPVITINNDGYWVVDDVPTTVLAQGPQGNAGNNGKSAYEQYVDLFPGYVWSEEQWMP